MKEVSIHEAETNLSNLLASVAEGEQFIISDDGRPIARLSPLNANTGKPVLGEDKGKVWIADDFDAPLSDGLSASNA